MKYKIFISIFLVFFTLIFCKFSSATISSEIYKQIKKDFSPLSALIIGIKDGQITIDKGWAQGVNLRDIFTVYKKGKKIVDPKTKKTLRFLKIPIGKIEITHLNQNFATASVISQKESFPIPAIVKRYTNLKVLIISENATSDKNLLSILKKNLSKSTIIFKPKLRFKQITPKYLLTNGYDLLFVEEKNSIKVYDANLNLIRFYTSLNKNQLSPSHKGNFVSHTYKAFNEFVTLQPVLLDKIPGEIIQSEFADIDNDDIPEMIYFNSQGLFIVKIKGKVLAHYKPKKGKIVNFSVGASGWIALNIFDKRVGMRSELLHYTSQGLFPVITNINLILNFVDYTAKGIKDTLIGQKFSPEKFFGNEVYILKRKNNELIYADKLKVPENYKNIGSAFIDFDKDGKPEIFTYLSDGRIGIYKNNKLVWSSPYPVINHFYQVKLIKGKPGQEVVKQVVSPFITPAVADVNRDGTPEALFVFIDFPLKSVKSDLKYIPLNTATSQIFVLGFKGSYFFKNITNAQTGFITGIGVVNRALCFTIVKGKYPGKTESDLYFSYF